MTTKKVRERLNQHRAAVKAKKPTSVAIHFNQPEHSVLDMQFGLLENQVTILKRFLQVKEATWIHLFDATTSGINLKDETDLVLDPNTTHIIKHFRHNMLCTPYTTHIVEEICQNKLTYAKRPKI